MTDQQQTGAQDSVAPEGPSANEGTPVAVPHIDFSEPTGNPLVEARKGYGLTPLSSGDSES